MKKPNRKASENVGRMVVKYHAHALTLFAVFWSLPSAIGVFGLIFFFKDHGGTIAGICLSLGFVIIHLWSIIAAIYYWCTERKRKVTVIKTQGHVF